MQLIAQRLAQQCNDVLRRCDTHTTKLQTSPQCHEKGRVSSLFTATTCSTCTSELPITLGVLPSLGIIYMVCSIQVCQIARMSSTHCLSDGGTKSKVTQNQTADEEPRVDEQLSADQPRTARKSRKAGAVNPNGAPICRMAAHCRECS